MQKVRIAILMGGESSEREVSLMTGEEMWRNLNRKKYEVMKIVWPEERNKLEKIKVNIALIALHGRGGEDGVIQGYLETLGIKYTGSGILASAIGMNKRMFRKLAEKEGFLMPREVKSVPCVVKPSNGGSSIGVIIVKRQSDLARAIKAVEQYDKEWLCEEYIKGIEVSCAVLGNKALPVIEIVPKNIFFDYEAKYISGMAEEICPARISQKLSRKVQSESLRLCQILGVRGYARVDFIISRGKVYLLEINTLPGMTANSLFPKAAKVAGISYPKLLDQIINLTFQEPL